MPTPSLLYPPQLDPSHGSANGYTKTYLNSMNDWESSAYEEAKKTQQMNPQISKVAGTINYLQGEFWDRKRPRYLSKFSDNRLENARYSTLAMLTDIRPTIDVHSLVDEFKNQADIAQQLIHHEWYNQSLDLSLINVADAAMLFGNAFWKIDAMTPGIMKFSPVRS